MKRILTIISTAILLCLSGLCHTSCNEIETINKGWWFYDVKGVRAKDSGSDFSEVDKAFDTYFAHGATVASAEKEWNRFLGKINDDKVIIAGEDFCKVTLYWDSDYDNPGIETIVVGSKTWCNRTEEQRY